MLQRVSAGWINSILIALGSAIGGLARYWLSGVVAERFGQTFPWGTLIVNATGSLVIGIFAALSLPEGRLLISPRTRDFVMIGVCGGYTTFSSFSLQTLRLAQEGEWLHAGGNILLSVALCLIGVWLGYAAGQLINR
jgi:CrcB protein